MKKKGIIFSLIIFVSLISQGVIKAQQTSKANCPEVSKFSILYLTPILLNEENKEQMTKLGIKEYDVSTFKFESDSLLLDNVIEYWLEREVSIATEEKDCIFINQRLADSNILETLPSGLSKFFYRIENRFIVFFQEITQEGEVMIRAEGLPVLLLDREGAVHELIRL